MYTLHISSVHIHSCILQFLQHRVHVSETLIHRPLGPRDGRVEGTWSVWAEEVVPLKYACLAGCEPDHPATSMSDLVVFHLVSLEAFHDHGRPFSGVCKHIEIMQPFPLLTFIAISDNTFLSLLTFIVIIHPFLF